MSEKRFEHGETYEIKILANAVSDEEFLIRIIDPLNPEYFTFTEHEWMMEYVRDYFLQYSTMPSYETAIIAMKEQKLRKQVRDPIVILAHKIFRKTENYIKDAEKIQESAVNFCKSRAYEQAAIKTAELVEFGKFDEINHIWEQTQLVGEKIYVGVDVDDIEDRKNNEVRENLKPLFSEALTKRMNGGIGNGEFIVIIAPMGAGKTMLASRQAAFNRVTGTNTLLVSLEVGSRKIRQRVDSCLLDVNLDYTRDSKTYLDEIGNRIKILDNGCKLFIEKHSASGTTANTIRNRLKILKSKGIVIDQVIIDYLDVMDCVDPKLNYKKDWEKFEYVSRDLYNLGQEVGISIIGFVQGNTTSIDVEVITAKSTSGGAKRLHPADAILGYARPPHFKEQERANFSFIKNRFGKDGFVLPVKTDYDKVIIEVQDQESYIVDDTRSKEDVNESVAERYKRFKEKKEKSEAFEI